MGLGGLEFEIRVQVRKVLPVVAPREIVRNLPNKKSSTETTQGPSRDDSIAVGTRVRSTASSHSKEDCSKPGSEVWSLSFEGWVLDFGVWSVGF